MLILQLSEFVLSFVLIPFLGAAKESQTFGQEEGEITAVWTASAHIHHRLKRTSNLWLRTERPKFEEWLPMQVKDEDEESDYKSRSTPKRRASAPASSR